MGARVWRSGSWQRATGSRVNLGKSLVSCSNNPCHTCSHVRPTPRVKMEWLQDLATRSGYHGDRVKSDHLGGERDRSSCPIFPGSTVSEACGGCRTSRNPGPTEPNVAARWEAADRDVMTPIEPGWSLLMNGALPTQVLFARGDTPAGRRPPRAEQNTGGRRRRVFAGNTARQTIGGPSRDQVSVGGNTDATGRNEARMQPINPGCAPPLRFLNGRAGNDIWRDQAR